MHSEYFKAALSQRWRKEGEGKVRAILQFRKHFEGMGCRGSRENALAFSVVKLSLDSISAIAATLDELRFFTCPHCS